MLQMEYYLKMRWLCTHPRQTRKIVQSLNERLKENQCIFEGKILPISLMPLMLNSNEFRILKKSSEILFQAIQKTIQACFSSPRVRQYFTHESVPRSWVEFYPGYKENVVIARLDALFDGKNIKYLEFNTDNPGGQAWTNIIENIIATHPFYRVLVSYPEETTRFKIMEISLKAVKEIYREFHPQQTLPLSIAFIDYKESQCSLDAKLMVDYFNKNGVKTLLVDPRDFRIQEGKAYVGNRQITLVRRYMKAQEFLNYPEKLNPFIEGYLNRAFCMVNSFRSVYGSEKSILALMSNTDFHHLYTPEEVQAIRKYIPWTRRLSDRETESPEGQRVQLDKFLKENRERMVLKPSWGYGGKGVIIGKESSPQEWEKLIQEHYGSSDWVVQEYVSIPTFKVPVVEGKKVTLQKKYFNLSPYVIHGEYAGVLGRLSDSSVINVSANGALLPILRY